MVLKFFSSENSKALAYRLFNRSIACLDDQSLSLLTLDGKRY
jgi:hypothetical protein